MLSKHLLEDFKIQRNEYIEIFSKCVNENCNFKLKNLEFPTKLIYLKYRNGKRVPLQIQSTTTVQHIISIIEKNLDFISGSVHLKYKNQDLKNTLLLLQKDLFIKENDEIEIEGSFFPKSILPSNYQLLDDMVVHIEKECIVCFEKIEDEKQRIIFSCGHSNVCLHCFDLLNQSEFDCCPICKK